MQVFFAIYASFLDHLLLGEKKISLFFILIPSEKLYIRQDCRLAEGKDLSLTQRNVTLDVFSKRCGEKIFVTKGDTGSITFIFSVCAGSNAIFLSEKDMTVMLRSKINEKTVIAACEITDGKAYYTLQNAFTAAEGAFECELAVYKGTGDDMKILYCPKFILYVQNNLADDGEIEADDRFEGLSVLINRAEAAAERAELAADPSVEGATHGNLAGFDCDGRIIDSGFAPSVFSQKSYTDRILYTAKGELGEFDAISLLPTDMSDWVCDQNATVSKADVGISVTVINSSAVISADTTEIIPTGAVMGLRISYTTETSGFFIFQLAENDSANYAFAKSVKVSPSYKEQVLFLKTTNYMANKFRICFVTHAANEIFNIKGIQLFPLDRETVPTDSEADIIYRKLFLSSNRIYGRRALLSLSDIPNTTQTLTENGDTYSICHNFVYPTSALQTVALRKDTITVDCNSGTVTETRSIAPLSGECIIKTNISTGNCEVNIYGI